MTIEKFDTIAWGAGMKVEAHGRYGTIGKRTVVSVDFDQCLIGIEVSLDPEDSLLWVRCENCELVDEE